MMGHNFLRLKAVAWVILLFFVGGCLKLSRGEREPTSYYVLSALTPAKAETRAPDSGQRLLVAVGPVHVPEYMDWPQVVTRTGDNRIEVNDSHRWAASLYANFKRALRENLSVQLPEGKYFVLSWRSALSMNYRILLDVTRFDGRLGGEVMLVATWGILGKDSDEALAKRESIFEVPTGANDYESYVSAMSKAVEKLSHEIATTLVAVEQK
jgi:uncharacterized lipoprotein YmbA